jgi:F-type H+-transporting ATPase subunit b
MKSRRRGLSLVAGGFLLIFLAVFPVLAAEAAEQEPAQSTTEIVFRWLNFLLVFGAVGYLIAKHGGAFFRDNAKSIAASIGEATAVKALAESELREVEAKIARFDQEVAELREAALRDSAAEAERLRASGRVEVEKINQAARAELASFERAVRQELRVRAASMAVERAGALVNSRMNADIRQRMFHAFLGELGRSAN